MKRKWSLLLLTLAGTLLMAFQMIRTNKITIYLIGDSTVCDQPIDRYPVTGWGTPFANYFDENVKIDNRAKGGRSTRTFLEENRWKPITDSLKSGDYVFIQFGHNDEAKEPQYAGRYTPVADYRKNLVKFITETRAHKAIPVLVTPVSRRKFDVSGNALETHADYSTAVFEVGKEYGVPVIDLDKKSRELYQSLGPEYSKLLFMELEPGEHPIYPNGQHDNTHFNDYGARIIAQMVIKQIKELAIPVGNELVKK